MDGDTVVRRLKVMSDFRESGAVGHAKLDA